MLLHKIRTLCKEQNITICELEQRALLSRNTISRWENTMPAADKLCRVARVLGTTVEELLN